MLFVLVASRSIVKHRSQRILWMRSVRVTRSQPSSFAASTAAGRRAGYFAQQLPLRRPFAGLRVRFANDRISIVSQSLG